MKNSNVYASKWGRQLVVAGLCAGALSGPLPTQAQTSPDQRRATVFEAIFPFYQEMPIECPGHYLDGATVSGWLDLRGIEKNAGFLTPWEDNGGGQHLQQIGARMTIELEEDGGSHEWLGRARGSRFTYNGGGGNGQHEGGVVHQAQTEYYHARGDYPDLYLEHRFLLVVDGQGNVRLMQGVEDYPSSLKCLPD